MFGVAVLASVFSAHGSYASPYAYTAGFTAALPVGAAILAVGALVALLVPGIRAARTQAQSQGDVAEWRSATSPSAEAAVGKPRLRTQA